MSTSILQMGSTAIAMIDSSNCSSLVGSSSKRRGQDFVCRSLSELVTTVTELKAMASAARAGLRKPCSPKKKYRLPGTPPIFWKIGYNAPAATGINMTL